MSTHPRLRQRLLGGLLLAAFTYAFCTVAGIGAAQEVPGAAAFALVVGVIVTPGGRSHPGANRRLVAVAIAWLALLGAYVLLLLHSVD